MSLFSFITDINECFEISNPLPPFIKFNKALQPIRLFWLPPFIRHLRVREGCTFCSKILLVTLSKTLVATWWLHLLNNYHNYHLHSIACTLPAWIESYAYNYVFFSGLNINLNYKCVYVINSVTILIASKVWKV